MALLGLATRAAAQTTVTATLASDDRFRGRSVSAGRPVASLDLAYDAADGAYAGLAFAGVATRHSGLQVLGAQEYVGYVRRLASGPSLDLGVTHADYTEYYGGDGSAHYTELYAGVITRRFAAHLYYSPDYFGRHDATLYGEVDAAVRPAAGWRLSAHAGALTRLRGPAPGGVQATQYDWRLGLARALTSFEVEFAWSGAGPDRDYYDGALRRRSGPVLSIKRVF